MISILILSIVGFALILFAWRRIKPVYAHCDTLDGPVVNAARKALAEHNPNYVLIWVRPEDESKIAAMFQNTLDAVIAAQTDADRTSAELALFDYVVKVHREGEGEEHDGLKPAGTTEKEIQIADRAVESGNLSEVENHIHDSHSMEHLRSMFADLQQKATYDVNDVPAGREYVHAYTHFIHTVEHSLKDGADHHEHSERAGSNQ